MSKQKLLGIINEIILENKEILNEQAIIEKFGEVIDNALAKIGPKFTTQFETKVEQLLGKRIVSATDEEIARVLQDIELVPFRQKIISKIYQDNQDYISGLFKSIDTTNPTQMKNVYSNIMKKFNIGIEWVKDIKNIYKSGGLENKSVSGYKDSFKQGLKTIQAPFTAARYAFRNVPIPGIRAYIRNNTTKLTPDEMNKIRLWFFTGVGDVNMIKTIWKEKGLPTALINVSGQLISKWVFWSTAYSICSFMIDVLGDTVGEEVYKNDVESWVERVKNNATIAELKWTFPIKIVYDQLIRPLMRGGIVKFQKEQYIQKLKELRDKANKYKDDVESKAKDPNLVKNIKKIVNPSDTTNTIPTDTTQIQNKEKIDF